MKKMIIATLTLILVLSLTLSVNAENEVNVTVDGELIEFEVQPFIDNNRTLVPVRFISESLGADVDWNQELKEVTITKNDKTIKLIIDNSKVAVNGEVVELDTKAILKYNTTFVPVSFISETLESNVNWNKDTRTVEITSNKAKKIEEVESVEDEEMEVLDRTQVRNIIQELRKTTIDENNTKEFVEPVFAIYGEETYIEYYQLIVKNMPEYKATGDEYKIRFIVLDENGEKHPMLNSYYNETDEWYEQDTTEWRNVNDGLAWWRVRKEYRKEKSWDNPYIIEKGTKMTVKIIIRNETKEIEKEYIKELVAEVQKGGELR